MTPTQPYQVKAGAEPPRLDEISSVPPRRRSGKVLAEPGTMNALVMSQHARFLGELDIVGLVKALTEETAKVRNGDLSYVEAMLIGQATTLQTVFASLLVQANSQDLKHWETYLRLGLKAQNQCRMTLETLAAIKNPPVVFARQANIANGPQQVNNNVIVAETPSPQAHAPAGNFTIPQTELLETDDGQRMDTRTAYAAIGAHTKMEAVGTVHRAAKRAR